MGIGMMLLGERAEGLLDLGLAGGLGYAQNFVGITHCLSVRELRSADNIGIERRAR